MQFQDQLKKCCTGNYFIRLSSLRDPACSKFSHRDFSPSHLVQQSVFLCPQTGESLCVRPRYGCVISWIEGQCPSSFSSVKACLCLLLQTGVTRAFTEPSSSSSAALPVWCSAWGVTRYPLPAVGAVMSAFTNFLTTVARMNLCLPKKAR